MAYSEDILKLRKRVLDAVNAGVVDSNLKDFYEATLLQIMNESERQRQHCVSQAETLRKQASVLDGQASGYSSVSSIVYNVLNSYIVLAEKQKREEAERAEEEAEKAAFAEAQFATDTLDSENTNDAEPELNDLKKRKRK